jgi:hypothetical protein
MERQMHHLLLSAAIGGIALAAAAATPAIAAPLPVTTSPHAAPATVEKVATWRRGWRRGYVPAPTVAVVPRAGPAVVIVRRPGNCGEFHYWDGMACIDARYAERHFK